MAKKIRVLNAATIISRSRFHCNTCGETGTWQLTQEEAEGEGEKHVEKPKNRDHEVMIDTETRTARALK